VAVTVSIDAERLFTVTQLATELGITARTLRFYEDRGLIAPRRIGPNRVYAARDRARMVLILRGKHLGFSLREIAEYLDLYDADPTHTEQLRVLAATASKRIAALERQRDAVDETLAELREILAQTTKTLAARKAS
jgi:DNA-binding transcriptional MerR regulator